MKVKVKYNQQTTLVEGYFPSSLNYPNNVIDTESKTIDGSPYIEITEEQHQEALVKQMCVIEGVFQEYVTPNDVLLKEGKASKIQETKTKRDIFLNSNIIVSTGEYKATQTAKNLFFNAVNGRTATQFPMLWRLADDVTWVSLLKDDAYELYDALEARQISGFQQESGFIRSINNAQTIEEVNAIIIEFR